MTLVSMPQWLPFVPAEYPKGMPPELAAVLPSLHAACVMVLSATCEHELYLAFGRDREFIGKADGTPIAPAIGLLRACISKSLILALASLSRAIRNLLTCVIL